MSISETELEKAYTKLLQYRDSIYASDLMVCAISHLGLFILLSRTPCDLNQICSILLIQPRPTDVLLTLLKARGLLVCQDGVFHLTDAAKAYLVHDQNDNLVPYFNSIKNRPQCLEFLDVLKTNNPAGWSSKKEGTHWLDSMQNAEFAQAFTDAMDSRGKLLAGKLANELNLQQNKRLLDIAGGSGIYACCIAEKHNHIEAAVLEIPPVDAVADQSIHNKGYQNKIAVISGDMFNHLPQGFDVHLYANVFHDWDISDVQQLAVNSYESLESNGCIIVFDAHLNSEKDGPLPVAEYSCLLMHSTMGRCYSTQEISEILLHVGFSKIAVKPVFADRTAIIGWK